MGTGKEKDISDVVSSIFERLKKDKEFNQESINEIWKTAAGESADKYSKPISLKHNVLVVGVDNSVWLHKLIINRLTMVDRVNAIIGKDLVKKIIFKIK